MLKNIVLLSILMLSSCSTDRKVSDKVSIMLDVPVSPIKRRGGVIAPRDGQFGAQRRLVDIAVGRRGRDAAQADALRGEGVARAEKGPHVLQRTDVVEHHRDGHLLHRGEFGGRRAAQLLVGYFTHSRFS